MAVSEHPSLLVLDTSAYSRFRAGRSSVLDLVSQAELVLLPVTVLGELEAGFELGSKAAENRRYLDEFLPRASSRSST